MNEYESREAGQWAKQIRESLAQSLAAEWITSHLSCVACVLLKRCAIKSAKQQDRVHSLRNGPLKADENKRFLRGISIVQCMETLETGQVIMLRMLY